MRILRVFPRRTKATPDDDMVRFREPDLFDQADEVHISVTFTWDIPKAEKLANAWKYVAPVKLGGPAFNEPGGEFTPGLYLKQGYVITSRGCPNRCWFCSVPKREGPQVRELKIKDGYNVLDDNILACSEEHIKKVFEMLKQQKQRAKFTGGLEAKRLKEWHCQKLAELKPKVIYFAYDTPDDYEPLRNAAKTLSAYGLINKSHTARCYVLIGYPGDSLSKAEKRLFQVMELGIMPMAMLYNRVNDSAWRKFQTEWANSTIVGYKMKQSKKLQAMP